MAKYVWGNPEITEITPPDKARVGAFPYGGGVPVESGEVFSVENAFRTIHTYYSVLPVPVLHTILLDRVATKVGQVSASRAGEHVEVDHDAPVDVGDPERLDAVAVQRGLVGLSLIHI